VSEADVAAQGVTPTLAAVAAAVGAPDFIVPWLDRFYDEADARLVLAAPSFGGADPEVLARAVRRAILDVDESGTHSPADFHERLEVWAMFEGWKDIPQAVHRELADWDVDFYAEKIRADVETVRDGHPSDSYEARYTYVLLDEAEAIVVAQDHIYLWPCDCRSLVGECRKPMDVCLRFENERGLGWDISKERAVEILCSTDKAGLMHTSDLRDDPRKASSICNCCTDCCYPHLAAARLGTGDVWPVRRHVAAIDDVTCEPCGRCARRCPFDAITADSVGRPTLEPAACRGCGLCSTTCPTEAITMRPLDAPA
jgi:Pyruvate/2-oxoacid:ferredoxin oxidoreductase delta subunit